MGRKSARANAFKLVFQMSFREVTELDQVLEYFFSEAVINDADKTYINKVTKGVLSNIDEIDGLVANKLDNWDKDRISRIDMAIMRVAVFEMLKVEDIPPSVAINEAVELGKKYGGDESPSFINGVLGAVEKGIK